MFNVQGKIAVVTGGGSGIGLLIAKELLLNGVKGCAIMDVTDEVGSEALHIIEQDFGRNKAIFIKSNVVDKQQFEDAFKATVREFKNIDILVNNAGILNDATWENSIEINIKGVTNGIILGMENYLQNYKSTNEAVIINMSSISALDPLYTFPVYSCTKAAVVGLTRAFGASTHYNRTRVKVVGICPGITATPMVSGKEVYQKTLGAPYSSVLDQETAHIPQQPSKYVASAVCQIIENGAPGSVWVAENSEPPYEIGFPTRRERRKI